LKIDKERRLIMETNDVLDTLGNMSVMELIALTKRLETQWGVKAEPHITAVEVQPQVETVSAQTEFDVILLSIAADKKIAVIKVVRELTGLGLKESKEMVEAMPKAIKTSISKTEADMIVVKLADAGGKAEIK
jgi:large subunit ribosomal protein L7/L12